MKLKILNLSNLFIYKSMDARLINQKYQITKCGFMICLVMGICSLKLSRLRIMLLSPKLE